MESANRAIKSSSVETLATPPKPAIIAPDVEKVAKSGEKWGKLWTTEDNRRLKIRGSGVGDQVFAVHRPSSIVHRLSSIVRGINVSRPV